jgi:hypothetical protein
LHYPTFPFLQQNNHESYLKMANTNLFSSINLSNAILPIAMTVVEGVKSRVVVGAIVSSSLPKVIPE